MIRLIRSSLILLAISTLALGQPTNPIQRLKLDASVVTTIPVALDRLTTIRFPSPVSDLLAATVSPEPHPDATFQVAFRPGSEFLSVRALAPNTNTTVNVIWKNQTYVLELIASHQPWLSVVFEQPPPPAPVVTNRAVTPARLLGLLDTARGFGLLRQQYPDSFAQVEVARPKSLHDYGDYTIRIEEVFRFNPEDTLVFRIALSNKTDTLIRYLPESLMVRVGPRVYYQSIAEATGIIPIHEEVPVYFAVTASADGVRTALSPHNDFMVLLNRLDAPASKPATPSATVQTNVLSIHSPSPAPAAASTAVERPRVVPATQMQPARVSDGGSPAASGNETRIVYRYRPGQALQRIAAPVYAPVETAPTSTPTVETYIYRPARRY